MPSLKMIHVIVVLVMLAALAGFALNGYLNKQRVLRDEARIADIAAIQAALAAYHEEHGAYPTDIVSGTLSPHLPELPFDASGSAYPYDQVDSGNSYYLGANLETRGHPALDNDADSDGTGVEGSDADGCGNERGLYCYDVSS